MIAFAQVAIDWAPSLGCVGCRFKREKIGECRPNCSFTSQSRSRTRRSAAEHQAEGKIELIRSRRSSKHLRGTLRMAVKREGNEMPFDKRSLGRVAIVKYKAG